MKERYHEFQSLNCEIIAIGFTPPERLAAYVQQYALPFPTVSDQERVAYRAFSLDRTTWKEMLRPRVVGRYLKLMLRGWMPQKRRDNDVLQLGGDFVVDADRRLVWAYRSADPTDRPTVDQLLAAVRQTQTRHAP